MKGIYLVTDRDLTRNKSLTEVILEAAKGGISMVQIREKNISTKAFIDECLEIQEVLFPFDIPLIINDRVDVALAIGAAGVHIGQNDMPYAYARKLLGKDAIIGLSVDTLDQLIEAQALDVDYLGVSGIFPTPTKDVSAHVWGLDGLRKAKEISRHPLVAIGGINLSNAKSVFAAGADGIAVVSAICASENPYESTQSFQKIYSNYLKKNTI